MAAERFHFGHYQRGKTFSRLVHQQNLGISDKGSGDRKNLLLPAGQRSRKLRGPLAQSWKQFEDAIHGPCWLGAGDRSLHSQQEILMDRVGSEHAAIFRHVTNAEPGDRPGLAALDRLPLQPDRSASWWDEAHDRFQRGRFADAIAAEETDGLSSVDAQADALQDVGLAVVGVKIFYLEQHACSSRGMLL
jgi:hypothetical protein